MHAQMHADVDFILHLSEDELQVVVQALRLYGSQDYPSKRYQTTIARGMREQLLGLSAS